MRIIAFLFLIIGLGYVGFAVYTKQDIINKTIYQEINVLLVYHDEAQKNSPIIEVYKSVLEEEGVPFKLLSNEALIALSAKEAAMYVPAIIMPEFVNQYILNSTDYWIGEYIKQGGKVALVHDVDTKDKNGNFKTSKGYLDRIIGIDFTAYHKEKSDSYIQKHIIFKNGQSTKYFQIPPGKLDDNLTIVGYRYGALNYPMLAVKSTDKGDHVTYATTEDNDAVIIQKNIGKGSVLYVNPPLGLIKGESDDLILRSILKTFFFKIATVPHIVSSPNAMGTIVLNWHIDSSIEYSSLPWNMQNNFLRKDFNQTFHITAGPDLDIKGDGMGFDAKGKGKELVYKMMEYGKIGSHGGWIHNWFAKNIVEKKLTKKEIKQYIQHNNDSLTNIIGYKPVEYSAPVGVFPPVVSLEVLKELGFGSYYYAGDSGSAPNRTFYKGKMLSKDIIAFPVMTFGNNASLSEMSRDGVNEDTMKHYYQAFIDYLVLNHTTRLFYGHPYDFKVYDYKDAVRYLFDYMSEQIDACKLQTRTMTSIRDFLLRLLSTNKCFKINLNGVHAEISNDSTLSEMVLAIPKTILGKRVKSEGYREDQAYYYVPLQSKDKAQILDFYFDETGIDKQNK